jgi:anti-anti-sigma factor
MENDPILDYVPEVAFSQREETLGGHDRVLKLDGELDMFITPWLRGRFHELAEERGTHLVVDLSDARFIDSTVLDAFVTGHGELTSHEGALAIVADKPYTKRTFELTGLDGLLQVCGSREEAFSRLS